MAGGCRQNLTPLEGETLMDVLLKTGSFSELGLPQCRLSFILVAACSSGLQTALTDIIRVTNNSGGGGGIEQGTETMAWTSQIKTENGGSLQRQEGFPQPPETAPPFVHQLLCQMSTPRI